MRIPQADQGPTAGLQSVSPTGFTHNGPGAGLAAISSTIRMSVAPDTEWAQIVGALVAPGPGRDAWSVERTRLSITSGVPDGQAPHVLGYVVDDYSAERAVITIITSEPDQSLTATTTTMVWSSEGDWRRELPSPTDQAMTPAVHALDEIPAQMISLPTS